ncbi:MAG: hypothetical protein P9M03_08445 [Candidatus Theseobacter exili]|nr:hypothetical protein [Candidatus Theseobacter exili]
MGMCGVDRLKEDMKYDEYVKLSIMISDSVYKKDLFKPLIKQVKECRNPGVLPLGAEIEMSNSGMRAIDSEPGDDPVFDNFYYFFDYDLTRRTWKLGGCVDAHTFSKSTKGRSRGFLEYSFGRFQSVGDWSKPITQGPWILSEMINCGLAFSGVRPHSLHIAIQVKEDKINYSKPSDVDSLLCLLLMGGDLGFDDTGRLREKRIYCNEILDHFGQLNFSRENIHYYGEVDGKKLSSTVIEYKFPRLVANRNYQPLILALKGHLIAENPRPLIPHPERIPAVNSEEFEEKQILIDWATHPQPLSAAVIRNFLDVVERGLMTEHKGKPAHSRFYIMNNLSEIEKILYEKNRLIKEYREVPK